MRTAHAALTFILGIMLTYFTFDWATALIGNVNSATYPISSALLWIAYVLATIILCVAGPLIIASKDDSTNIISILKGYGLFWAACIVVVITIPLATTINNAVQAMIANDFSNQVFWFITYLMYAFVLIIFPTFIALRPSFWAGEEPE